MELKPKVPFEALGKRSALQCRTLPQACVEGWLRHFLTAFPAWKLACATVQFLRWRQYGASPLQLQCGLRRALRFKATGRPRSESAEPGRACEVLALAPQDHETGGIGQLLTDIARSKEV